MTTAREKKRGRRRRRSNHTLFADNSIFRQRVKNSENKPVEKNKTKSSKNHPDKCKRNPTKITRQKERTVLVLPRNFSNHKLYLC
jgi:hypothetical protein